MVKLQKFGSIQTDISFPETWISLHGSFGNPVKLNDEN